MSARREQVGKAGRLARVAQRQLVHHVVKMTAMPRLSASTDSCVPMAP